MPRETEKHSLMMIGGKQIGGQRPGGRNQDGSGMTKSEGFFFSLRISHPRSGNYCVCDGWVYTHSGSHAHFSDTFSLRGVQTSRTRMAQGVCSARVISPHLTFSLLMFHPPSLLFPHGHFDTSFPSALSLPNCSRSESAGLTHFRTSGEEFGYLADPTHSTGYEPKEFDKITSEDGDTTPINDPNYDNISDFSKITRENTGLFGVSTILEASVSHVSHGVSKDSMHRETVARQREREKKEKVLRSVLQSRFQRKVDGTVLGVILFKLTEKSILMNETSEKTWNEEHNKLFLVNIQLRELHLTVRT